MKAGALIVIMGLPGTGKSTLAQKVAKDTQAIHISSDQIRVELGLRGSFSYRDKETVYLEMLNQTGKCLCEGKKVIVDATFSRVRYRVLFGEMAKWQQVSLHVIELSASSDTIEFRVRKKRPLSEANYAVYEKLLMNYEAPTHPSLRIITDQLSLEQQAQLVISHCTKVVHT